MQLRPTYAHICVWKRVEALPTIKICATGELNEQDVTLQYQLPHFLKTALNFLHKRPKTLVFGVCRRCT